MSKDYILMRHEDELDGTKMYPLKHKINLKQYFFKDLLPSLAIYLLISILFTYLLEPLLSSVYALAFIPSVVALVASTGFLIKTYQEEISELGWTYFTKFESGRRVLINYIISVALGILGLYYVHISFGILSLLLTQILIFVGLLIFNIIMISIPYELASYLVVGILTFFVSMLSFSLVDKIVFALGLDRYSLSWIIPQTISFILCNIFSYSANRSYVFQQQGSYWKGFWNFISTRLASTLVVEYGGLFVFVNLLNLDRSFSKILVSLLVSVVNYFIAKFWVFKED